MRTCAACPSNLDPRNRTGYCRRHLQVWLAENPHIAARKVANHRAAIMARPAELRSANARKAALASIAWCPLEYRDEYTRLKRSLEIPAAEARRIIEDLIAAHAERYRRTGQLQQAA